MYSRLHAANFIEIGQGLGFVFCLRTRHVYSALYSIRISSIGLSSLVAEVSVLKPIPAAAICGLFDRYCQHVIN